MLDLIRITRIRQDFGHCTGQPDALVGLARQHQASVAADVVVGETGFHGAFLDVWKLEQFGVTNCVCGNGVGFVEIYPIDIWPRTPLELF